MVRKLDQDAEVVVLILGKLFIRGMINQTNVKSGKLYFH